VSEFLDRTLEHEIDSMNDHLPKKVIPLAVLLETERPSYETRSGLTSVIRREEIDFLAREVPKRLHQEFMLPIVMLRRVDLGLGIYSVAGGQPELFLIQRVLGYVDLGWEGLTGWKSVDRLVRPQVRAIRRKLPSATCLGFTTSQDPS
jgi:uncharacterized protein (UPF0216 family)